MQTSATAPKPTSAKYASCTDAELVIAALLGNVRAFDVLTRRYRSAVIATAAPLVKSRAAAEDLSQEVFLAAFFALPQLEDPARFGGWVRTIARRQAQRHLSRERVRRADLPLLEEVIGLTQAPPCSNPEAALAEQEEREMLWTALQTLPAPQREILWLFAHEDWSVAHIADYLSIEQGTARVRLFRARQALRQVWETLHGVNAAASQVEKTKGRKK